jgi:ATP-dependent RNA helicase DeaD
VITKTAHKISAIRRFLDIQPDMRGIMFCRTRRETQKIADELGNLGYGVEALHGDLSQSQRDSVMRRFKNRAMQLLIATDVAARGIDVDNLTHVFHHTLPDQIEYYTHRAGRTARAGKTGISLAFINPREGKRITELEKKNKVKFEHVEVPTVDDLRSSRINNWANLIINTKVDEQAEEILHELHGQFAHLSKEDILKRLITTQLDHLSVQSGEEDNLNEKNEKRRESAGKQSKSGFHRYFINVGLIDGVTKSDLIHFISDISEIKRKYIGDIKLQKNCAFFDVDANYDKDLSKSFRGIDIEGRSIRVNRDDEGNKRDRPSYEGRKKSKRKPAGRKTSGRRKERRYS